MLEPSSLPFLAAVLVTLWSAASGKEPQKSPSPPASPSPGPAAPGDVARWDAPELAKSIKNPLPASAENLEKGASHFKRFCVPCHGSLGKGDGPVARYWVQPPKDLSDPARQARLSDGEIFWKLSRGHRQGADVVMPAFSERMPAAEDRWKLVLYVRTLRAGPPPRP